MKKSQRISAGFNEALIFLPYNESIPIGKQDKTKEKRQGRSKSILVICQELFEKDFDVFFRKGVTLTDLRYVYSKIESQFGPV